MSLWTVGKSGPKKVAETAFRQEKLLEQHLEDWIEQDPSILGEQLFVIGRQIRIPDTQDRLDLLALDPRGASVIIELKRGKLKDPVDVQALRYASYVSKWRFENFENVARSHLGAAQDSDFNFNSAFEEFCANCGVDDVPDVNEEQRIIILGSSVKDKLGSVVLWLREHNVDIKLIEIRLYKNGDELLIEPNTIVPLPVDRFAHVGGKAGSSPWIVNGRDWHLEKKCSPRTRDMLLQLDKLLTENLDLDGESWGQKHYVAYRVGNFNWLCILTKPTALWLDIHVKPGSLETEEISRRLKLAVFDKEESLSEKLSLPSSVIVRRLRETVDRIRIRVKEDFDLSSEAFVSFLRDAYKARPK